MKIFIFSIVILSIQICASGLICDPKPGTPVNKPMGTSKGIYPGRVVWSHNPDVTKWSGDKDSWWWTDEHTDLSGVQTMLGQVFNSLAFDGHNDLRESVKKILTLNGKSYKVGDKIAIKINANSDIYSPSIQNNGNEVSPQFIKSLLRILVYSGGVKQEDIFLYDCSRFIAPKFTEAPQGCGKEFPNVHWFQNHVLFPGREECIVDWDSILELSNHNISGYNITKLPIVATQARFMISVSDFRGHSMAGITMTGKNFFGSVYREDAICDFPVNGTIITVGHWCPIPFHAYANVTRNPMKSYNVLVDLLGHPDIGGKGVLYLSDGLYGGIQQNQVVNNSIAPVLPIKFKSSPFDNHWSSSIFGSQDPIALDSVAFDILRNEPAQPWPKKGCVDNYLHEAAMANNPPSGIIYNPSGRDGERLQSLGVHEHWNNPNEKMYSKNLDSEAKGIELIYLFNRIPKHSFMELLLISGIVSSCIIILVVAFIIYKRRKNKRRETWPVAEEYQSLDST